MYFVTGCAGFFVYPGSLNGSGSSSNGDYVYVANATAQTVAGFSVSSGTLTALTGSPFSLGFVPASMVVNPSNSIVFIGSSSAIYAYAINSSTGALSILNNGSAVYSVTANAMDISPDGQWLVALSATGSGVILNEFSINSTTGALSFEQQVSYTSAGATPNAVKYSPNGTNGQYLFVAMGLQGYLVYPFTTSTGLIATPPLTPQSLITNSSFNALAVSPSGNYVYMALSGPTPQLLAYSIGSGGALTGVGSSVATGTDPFSVAMNNAGTYVYVANQVGGTISGYSVASNGALTALSSSPYASQLGSSPWALAVDNSKDYLLAASYGGNPDLTMYSFDTTTPGQLDFSASYVGSTSANPVAIAATH
jgi:6-phosphogluconolactonase (cycloisomerase 2 family)